MSSSNEFSRPLPDLNEPDTRSFWLSTRENRLVYQVCDDCDQVIFYPRRHCPSCGGLSTTEHDSAGLGVVYTYTIVRQSGVGFFAKRVPYVIAYVDMDEGFRIMTEVLTDNVDVISVGARVKVAWENHPGLSIPLFSPVEET